MVAKGLVAVAMALAMTVAVAVAMETECSPMSSKTVEETPLPSRNSS